jgi:putative oxidoreductase
MRTDSNRQQFGTFLLRLLLGTLFIAHLYWKFAILPGGIPAWWSELVRSGYLR